MKITTDGTHVCGWVRDDSGAWISAGSADFAPASGIFAGLCVAARAPRGQFASAEFETPLLTQTEMNSPGTEFTLPREVELSANVIADSATNLLVRFIANGDVISRLAAPPWTFLWTNAAAGVKQLSAVLEADGSSLTSAPVTLRLNAPAAQVWVQNPDEDTAGNWSSRYGREFDVVPGVLQQARSNITVMILNASTNIFGPSTNPAALQVQKSSIASQFTGDGDLQLALAATDYSVHRAALYFFDWEHLGSTQSVFFSAAGETLEAPVAATSGVYLPFAFQGAVSIRIHNPCGKAYLTGIFGDTVSPVSAELVEPADGESFRVPAAVTLAAEAFAPGREITSLEFWDGTKRLAALSSPPYSLLLSNLLDGVHQFRAVARGSFGLSGESDPAAVTLLPPEPKAVFLGSDTNTHGSWIYRYGADGFEIFASQASLPPFVEAAWQDANPFVFAAPAVDPSALEEPFSADRIAACVYGSPECSAEVQVRDGAPCAIGFYFLDWGDAKRVMTVEVEDSNQTLLDRREVRDFSEGKYFFWNVQGHVKFRFKATSANAVISGIFVDRGLTAFQLWKNNLFVTEETGTSDEAFALSDFDGDGVNNAEEYLFGYDARSASDKPASSITLRDGFLSISYSVRSVAPGIHLGFEASDDLARWKKIEPITAWQFGNGQISGVRFQFPVTAGNARFYRAIPVTNE